MRISLVYPAVNRRGGVERVVWEAARHLSPNHEVTVVAAAVKDLPASVSFHQVDGGPFEGTLGVLRFFVRAKQALDNTRADIAVGFGSNCPALDVLVMQSVHRSWVSGGGDVKYGPVKVPSKTRMLLPRHQVRLLLEYSAINHGTWQTVVAVSANVVDDLARFYGLPPERAVVVPNGYDPVQCSPIRRAGLRAAKRAELGLRPADFVLLLIANEYHRKGLAVLLEAMASLRSPRLRLLLVGRMEPGAYMERARALGIDRQVRYCGPADDVAEYHAAADLFVLPTQYEAFGSVIVEALASGLPVVTTARAGAAVAVQPDVNGLLQDDPYSAKELASLLRTSLEPGSVERWSEAAGSSVVGYEWPVVMQRFEEVLMAVAKQKGR